MNRRLFALVISILATTMPAVASLATGTQTYTLALPSILDRSLVGKRVDIYVRRLGFSQQLEEVELVLSDVPLIAAPADRREATFALTDQEIRRLRKYEKVGRDLVIRMRDASPSNN